MKKNININNDINKNFCEPNLLGKSENDEENSDNLSDIAEEILDTFQGNNTDQIDINSYSNPNKEVKNEFKNNINDNMYHKKQKSEMKIVTPFQNKISDLKQIQMNQKMKNDNIIKENINEKNEIGMIVCFQKKTRKIKMYRKP